MQRNITCPKCRGIGEIALPKKLEATLSAVRDGAHTTEALTESLPKVKRTAQNNRLEALRKLGLLEREKDGKAWIYRPLKNGKK